MIANPELRFLFRLAISMGRTVSELLAGMSAIELNLWFAFHELEPFGPRQDDFRAAVTAILPASAISGEQFGMGSLFRSLKQAGDEKPAKSKIGAGFRAWARSNAPACVAVDPSQKSARP
jgi:hypothetical protein